MANLSASFVINGTRWSLELRLQPIQFASKPGTIDLVPVAADALELAITGSFPGGGGQCQDALRAAAMKCGAADLVRICDLWDRWHLNGLRAGTRAQAAHLATIPHVEGFSAKRAALIAAGLEPDLTTGAAPYSYGSAWLYEPLDSGVAESISDLFRLVDGMRYGTALDAPGERPEQTWESGADRISAEDVTKHMEALREYIAGTNFDDLDDDTEEGTDLWRAKDELEALEREGSSLEHAAENSEQLILDADFESYARELAEDCGMVKEDAAWPNNHIDWKAAAHELKQDYTMIRLNGHDYLTCS
jgi:hypothetical protein